MMIVWQGWGILVAVLAGGAMALAQVAGDAALGPGGYARNSTWLAPLALLVAAAVVWPLGRRLNGGQGRVMTDKETGREVVLRRSHSLFFIRMEHWALIMAGAALVLMVYGLAR
jgi:hypothetical protein